MERLNILFVCIGNTCRSPMAEAIMSSLIKARKLNWSVDSAGLREWNCGILPNDRTIKVLNEHGLTSSHIGRMITEADFYNFDYILAMDNFNMRELFDFCERLQNPPTCVIELLGSYLPNEADHFIRDPYFSESDAAFRHVYVQITESCKMFIKAKTVQY